MVKPGFIPPWRQHACSQPTTSYREHLVCKYGSTYNRRTTWVGLGQEQG